MRNLIGVTIPPRLTCKKEGNIWRVTNGNSGYSGNWEGALKAIRNAVEERESFFKTMQERGKYFPHRPIVLCGTAYEWHECPTCGMKIVGSSNVVMMQWWHDKEQSFNHAGGTLNFDVVTGWKWTA